MLLLTVVAAADAAASEQLVIGGHRRQRSGVRREVREPPLVQRRDGGRRLPRKRRDGCADGWLVLRLGGLAGLQSNGVGGQGSGPQRGGQARDHVLVGEVPVQQQDLDQSPGAVPLAVNLAGLGPPGIMNRGELARGPGLFQGCGTGEGARLADEGFEIVVQVQAAAALRDQPLVTGHLDIPVVNHQVRGMQDDSHPLADQAGRDRVAVGPDGDLAIAVDPWREQPTGLERLLRQRHQQRLLDGEVLVDSPRPRTDPPVPVVQIPLVDELVQLGERVDFRDRREVVPAEVADHPFDAALLVGAFDAWAAVEALDVEVRAEGDPPVGLHPRPIQPQHLGDGRFQVVVADLAPRDTAQHAERVHVPFEESFLAAGGEDPVDGFARVGHAEREQVAGHQLMRPGARSRRRSRPPPRVPAGGSAARTLPPEPCPRPRESPASGRRRSAGPSGRTRRRRAPR